MKEKEKRRLFIHPKLGYGTEGLLPPNSLLIFDVVVVKAETRKDAKESREPLQDNQHPESSPDNPETSFKWFKKVSESIF